jgi:hypothetical protein
MELYCTPKVNTLQYTQSATLRTHVHVRPARSRNTNSYRILPTGPLVAIFQHSLPFLQSEGFETHVGTIHRRAIGPLAHHNGTSAYSPSLTCHLPAPTIGCLHRPPYKLACFRPNLDPTHLETILSHTVSSSSSSLAPLFAFHNSTLVLRSVYRIAVSIVSRLLFRLLS